MGLNSYVLMLIANRNRYTVIAQSNDTASVENFACWWLPTYNLRVSARFKELRQPISY